MPAWALDTNILLYLVNGAAAEHAIACRALKRLLTAGERVSIAPQSLFEFWAVATRPVDANGLGWTIEQAGRLLTFNASGFPAGSGVEIVDPDDLRATESGQP
ncbi:MAG: hypothetical protein HY235_18290 [Acidobacteria bacterium]|nr:hypothetical protein [Acidobacteriota bacterium]